MSRTIITDVAIDGDNPLHALTLAQLTLDRACADGHGDTPQADAIRNTMDEVAQSMTPEQLEVFRKLAEILNEGGA